jgi:hypothetical protein
LECELTRAERKPFALAQARTHMHKKTHSAHPNRSPRLHTAQHAQVNHYVGQQVAQLHASVHGGGECALKDDDAAVPGVWAEVVAS